MALASLGASNSATLAICQLALRRGIEAHTVGGIKGEHQNGFNEAFTRWLDLSGSLPRPTASHNCRPPRHCLGPAGSTLGDVTGGGAWRNTKLRRSQHLTKNWTFLQARTVGEQRTGAGRSAPALNGLFDNWSAKIQYDYLDFGNKSIAFNGLNVKMRTAANKSHGISTSSSRSIWSLSAQLHFNWWR